jgi:hypothetical protein
MGTDPSADTRADMSAGAGRKSQNIRRTTAAIALRVILYLLMRGVVEGGPGSCVHGIRWKRHCARSDGRRPGVNGHRKQK